MNRAPDPDFPSRPHGERRVFAHLNAELAPLYRAILEAFVGAKDRFVLHLRPEEVVAALPPGTPR